MITHFTKSHIQYPIVELFSLQPKLIESLIDDTPVTDLQMTTAIECAMCQMLPTVFAQEAMERRPYFNYQWVIRAINLFLNCDYTYPESGFLTEFHGKKFKEIPRRYQRRINESKIEVVVLHTLPLNDGKADTYRSLVKNIDLANNGG